VVSTAVPTAETLLELHSFALLWHFWDKPHDSKVSHRYTNSLLTWRYYHTLGYTSFCSGCQEYALVRQRDEVHVFIKYPF
jgi:hypothetical protein